MLIFVLSAIGIGAAVAGLVFAVILLDDCVGGRIRR
jgi:hypothetical protein